MCSSWSPFGLIGLTQLDPSAATRRPSRHAASAQPQPNSSEAFALQLHSGDEKPPLRDLHRRDRPRPGPTRSASSIHGYQENAASEAILPDARKTPSDRRLGELIDYAHKKELRVALMPVILLAKRRGSEWRGKINPDNWDEWWKDYRKFLLNYAQLSEKHHVELFSVGSELITTERQTDRWRALIRDVRKAYGGRLTYSANWDHYSVPAWWNDLDIVGMTTYYTLAKGEGASLETLVGGWQQPKKEILEWQKTVARPILFTEVGWPNQVDGGRVPMELLQGSGPPRPRAPEAVLRELLPRLGRRARDGRLHGLEVA